MNDYEVIELGYYRPRRLPDGTILALCTMNFTVGLFVGIDEDGYRTRYCYEHADDAESAIDAWDGTSDPPGPWIKQKPEDRLNPNWSRS